MNPGNLSPVGAALTLGTALAGLVLILAVFRQKKTGETYCPVVRGKVCLKENPKYFAQVFWFRLILGMVLLAGGFIFYITHKG